MSSDSAWKVTPAEGIAIQRRLAGLVRRVWDGRPVRLIAGADVHFPTRKTARAVVVLLDFPGLGLVETATFEGACTFPYVPGLLSFREIPPILEAWQKLARRPDLILCDGQGIAHPRGIGFASHLGLELGIPTIGCAKSPLFGDFKIPRPSRGDRSPIKDPAGRTIGAVLRTRDRTKPLYVSVGHLISLRKAISFVLAATPRFRNPEPLRIAHQLARQKSGGPG